MEPQENPYVAPQGRSEPIKAAEPPAVAPPVEKKERPLWQVFATVGTGVFGLLFASFAVRSLVVGSPFEEPGVEALLLRGMGFALGMMIAAFCFLGARFWWTRRIGLALIFTGLGFLPCWLGIAMTLVMALAGPP